MGAHPLERWVSFVRWARFWLYYDLNRTQSHQTRPGYESPGNPTVGGSPGALGAAVPQEARVWLTIQRMP
jgi:hypothetical protein